MALNREQHAIRRLVLVLVVPPPQGLRRGRPSSSSRAFVVCKLMCGKNLHTRRTVCCPYGTETTPHAIREIQPQIRSPRMSDEISTTASRRLNLTCRARYLAFFATCGGKTGIREEQRSQRPRFLGSNRCSSGQFEGVSLDDQVRRIPFVRL